MVYKNIQLNFKSRPMMMKLSHDAMCRCDKCLAVYAKYETTKYFSFTKIQSKSAIIQRRLIQNHF